MICEGAKELNEWPGSSVRVNHVLNEKSVHIFQDITRKFVSFASLRRRDKGE